MKPPVDDPASFASVTAELGPDPWELANPERCRQDDEQGEWIQVDGIHDITPGGPGFRLVPRP